MRWDGNAYRVVVPEQAGTAASLTYRVVVPEQAGTAASLTYPPPDVVAEFHSHGKGRAFFSKTDDKDEQGFRIYGVVGRLDTPERELSLRVGVYGHFAPVQWSQVFGGPNPSVRLMGEEAVSTGSKDITTTRR